MKKLLIFSALAVILSSICLLKNPALKLELPDETSVLSMEMDRFSAAPRSPEPLTLDDVRELARKGDNLVSNADVNRNGLKYIQMKKK